MKKLLIIDDEPIILAGLMNTYPWEEWGFTLVGSATRGHAALTLIEKQQPDVVISDIRMKDMTGLEVLEQTMTRFPDILFVMISAYRDFEYAQKACQLGAYSYLLKPLDEEELKKTMLDIADLLQQKQIDTDLSRRYNLFLTDHSYHYERSLLRSYIQGYMDIKEFIGAYFFTNPDWQTYRVAVVSISIDISTCLLQHQSGHYILLQYIQTHRQSLPFGYAFEKPENGLYYLTVLKNGEVLQRDRFEKLFEQFEKEFHLDVVFTFSKEYPSLLDARSAASEADFLLKVANDVGLDQLYPETAAEELDTVESSGNYYPDQWASLILRSIQAQNYPSAKKNFEKFVFALSGNHNVSFQKTCLLRLTTELYTAFYGSALLSEALQNNFEDFIASFGEVQVLKTIPAIHQLIRGLIPQLSSQDTPASANSYVEKAKLYAQEHISDEYLNVTVVSEMLFLNPVYFGKLFKKTTGKGFKTYLLEIRIAYAKRQLTGTTKSISTICQEIGIPNASYFSQLFKASEGCLPTEYRKEHLL